MWGGVFSRREREYLQLVVRPASGGLRAPGEDFSPEYQRKLQWSIRRKASRALSDWALFAAASRSETKLLPHSPATSNEGVLVHSEPFAAAIKYLAQKMRRPRDAPRPRGAE
jgi:hypothetical protein